MELTNTTVRTAVAGDGQGGALQLSGSNHLTLTNSTLATSVHNGTDTTGTSRGYHADDGGVDGGTITTVGTGRAMRAG